LQRPGVSLAARPVGTIAGSILALIAALAVGASTAQAADVTVGLGGCDQQGGQVTVPAGSTITARGRIFDITREVLTNYLPAQQTTLSVNGVVVDLTDSYTPPAKGAAGVWFTDALDSTGITLANAGDSVTMTLVGRSRICSLRSSTAPWALRSDSRQARLPFRLARSTTHPPAR